MPVGKRLFDILASSIGLIVISPFLSVIGLTILLVDGSPVFFRQRRVGLHGEIFLIYKFRTMVRDANRLGKPLTVGADSRITPLGHWLRKYKIDELPQLINVLKREMSLVGPRPEVPEYVALYTSDQRKVLELIPGITDPASIAYSNESDLLVSTNDPEFEYINKIMPEKIRLNLEYSARATVWNDMAIILGTFGKILR